MLKTSYILNSAKPTEYLEKSLSRLRSMKRSDEEFIVVYAGTDDISRLQLNNPWVDQWIVEKDKGEAHGLNKGILASRGCIIRPLSDDDIFYDSVIHEAIDKCFDEDVDVVFVTGRNVDGDGKLLSVFSGKIEDILNFKNGCGLSICFRRSIVPLIGLFDTRFIAVDLDFICRIIRSGVTIRGVNKIGFERIVNPLSGVKRFPDRVASDTNFVILNNTNLILGKERLVLSMINDILHDSDYAQWLGSYITTGLLLFPLYKFFPVSLISPLMRNILRVSRFLGRVRAMIGKISRSLFMYCPLRSK